MVGKVDILLRIEDLEQRTGRISTEIHSKLVYLIEDENGVHRPRLTHSLNDPARQRADVRAPMATELGLVPDASEANPHKLAPQSGCDASAKARLADTRWPDETQQRSAHP